MAVDMELTPKTKRAARRAVLRTGRVPRRRARRRPMRMAAVAKALGDPVRLQLVDVLRKHAGKVCVCELVPLFDLSQPTVSHHLKVLREAGIVGSERQGLWAYYFVIPDALQGAVRMAELENDVLHPRRAGRLLRAVREGDVLRRIAQRRVRLLAGPAPDLDDYGDGDRRAGPRDRPREVRLRGAWPPRLGRRPMLRPRRGRAGCSARLCMPTAVSASPGGRAIDASLGCGVPTAVADLHDGETVLDLGSGAGADVLDLRPPRRPDRQGDRPGHDRRDARARARQRHARPASRTSSSSRATSRTCRSRTRASTWSSPTA